MRFVDAEQVHALLDYPSLVPALESYHREGIERLDELLLTQPGAGGAPRHFFLRAAWAHERALGAKLFTVFPDNVAATPPLPSVQAVYVLFDGKNGSPLALIDGTALTYYKTAADSALGAKFLARADAEAMLMVGAGAMAPHLIRAHTAVRPSIRRVLIWNRTPARAARLTAEVRLDGVPLAVAPDLEDAVRAAHVISCATMSRTPLVRGEWLRPGAHLDLVGGFAKDMREADDEAVRRASVYVDSRATAAHVGDIALPMASGALKAENIRADLFELCQGKASGRERADEITLFKNAGGGHLDLMTARFLLTRLAAGTPCESDAEH